MNSRVRNILWCLSPFFISYILQFAGSFMAAGMWFAAVIHGYSGSSIYELSKEFQSEESLSLYLDFAQLFYAAIACVVFFIMYKKFFCDKKDRFYNRTPYVSPGREPDFSLGNISIVKTAIGTILLVAGLTILVNYILLAVSAVFPDWLQEFIELEEQAGLTGDLTPLTFLYAVILGPISEELIFRGCTFEYARRGTGAAGAILIQALLFAALHMNKLQSTYTFVIGLALGYIYYISGNIFWTVVIHILYNGFQFYQPDMPKNLDTPVGVFLTVMCGFIAVYGGIVLFKNAYGISGMKEGKEI